MDKVKEAENAIDKVFSDTSVSQDETASRLRGLVDHINELLSTLDVE